MGVLLGMLIVTPMVFAAVGRLVGIPGRVWGPAAAGLAAAGGFGLGALVAVGGSAAWVVADGNGRALIGLQADQLVAVLLPLVCTISAVVQLFARRYLWGDRRAERFFAATAVLTSATAILVSAASMVVLALGWTVAGCALCVLLGLYAELPTARDGLRRTARAFAVGDLALWVAVTVIVIDWGDGDLRAGHLSRLTATGWWQTAAVAALLLLAAASRSAQLPFHRWLPATLAAPTPVSALLHAGVVNAGAILLLRSGSIVGSSTAVMHAAFILGAATAVYATVLMLTKPDIKGALAHSTMGQMGFMIMTCGLGLFAASIFHLVGHGMYKATLFLGSGSAVRRHLRRRHAPPPASLSRKQSWTLGALASVIPAAVVFGAVSMLPETISAHNAGLVMVFAWATAAWASWAWLRQRLCTWRVLAAVIALIIAIPAYLAA
ncbi:proton-conducting transporter membrane subunit, partial [uncultured Mycobacterium sp.]|uniref:proton-conducting transporter transmembrane domain-containing protein n=1 Tax=uncultured Mycobacterium sp. TaxID=171292 RepID=UPI0035CB34F9